MRKPKGEIVANWIINLIIFLLCVITLYPFIHTLLVSFVPQGIVGMSTKQIFENMATDSWRVILKSSYMWQGFMNSVVRVVLGSGISILVTVMMAYPLSKKNLVFGRFFNALLSVTMTIGAGIIPTYLLMKNLHIIDTIWVLILPNAVNVFNLMVIRNFFASIPDSLEESARLDGANDYIVLFKIVLPLSLPSIATILLWLVVDNWNSWFDVVLYINSREKYLLPAILQELITQDEIDASFQQINGAVQPNTESMKAATTMFTMIPVLLVYPFLQKYFASGIMVGAVKG